MAPESLSHIFAFAIYFPLLLFSDLLNQKYKIHCCVLFLFILFGVRSINLLQFPHVCLPILGRRYPKGIDNPFYTSGCEYLLFVCRGCLRCVAWFSYQFDNLGFISEGNTYRRCAASSLPLWGNTDVASSRNQRPSPVLCRRGNRSWRGSTSTLLQFIYFYVILHFYLSFYIYQYQISSLQVTVKGLTTPLTRRGASICSLCAGTIYIVLLGTPTSSITLVS